MGRVVGLQLCEVQKLKRRRRREGLLLFLQEMLMHPVDTTLKQVLERDGPASCSSILDTACGRRGGGNLRLFTVC